MAYARWLCCVSLAAATEIITSFNSSRSFPAYGPEGFSYTTLSRPDLNAAAYVRVYLRNPNIFYIPSPSDSLHVLDSSQSKDD